MPLIFKRKQLCVLHLYITYQANVRNTELFAFWSKGLSCFNQLSHKGIEVEAGELLHIHQIGKQRPEESWVCGTMGEGWHCGP